MKTKKMIVFGLALTLLTASKTLAIESMVIEPVPPAPLLIEAPQPVPVTMEPVPVMMETQSPAYRQYLKRPVSELSKLIYLGDVLKASNLVVMYGGMTYVPRSIAPMVTMYVRMNYKKETAEAWVEKHAYRNGPSYRILYVKDADGNLTVLRDFLLEQLKDL